MVRIAPLGRVGVLAVPWGVDWSKLVRCAGLSLVFARSFVQSCAQAASVSSHVRGGELYLARRALCSSSICCCSAAVTLVGGIPTPHLSAPWAWGKGHRFPHRAPATRRGHGHARRHNRHRPGPSRSGRPATPSRTPGRPRRAAATPTAVMHLAMVFIVFFYRGALLAWPGHLRCPGQGCPANRAAGIGRSTGSRGEPRSSDRWTCPCLVGAAGRLPGVFPAVGRARMPGRRRDRGGRGASGAAVAATRAGPAAGAASAAALIAVVRRRCRGWFMATPWSRREHQRCWAPGCGRARAWGGRRAALGGSVCALGRDRSVTGA